MRTRKADMINLPELPKPMTKEEKTELFNNWNDDSWKVLAERNMRLALSIANKFYNTGIEDEELFGIAQLGLVKASRSYRPETGFQFATYSTRVITNEILLEIRKTKKRSYQAMSLNEPLVFGHDGDTCEFGELIACTKNPFEEIEERQFLEYIREVLTCFTEKEQRVIFLSLDGLKQREIAEITGFSQSYISRILGKCKVKFKQRLRNY